MRETELKYSIRDPGDFFALRDGEAWGERDDPEVQVDDYFDTVEFALASKRILLRIRSRPLRARGSTAVLTLKHGREVSAGLFDAIELECELDRETVERARAVPEDLIELAAPPVDELRRLVGRPRLTLAGRIETERTRRRLEGLVLEVDRLEFPDGYRVYELEVETSDPESARPRLESLLAARGLLLEPLRLTKFERFLVHSGKIRGGVLDRMGGSHEGREGRREA